MRIGHVIRVASCVGILYFSSLTERWIVLATFAYYMLFLELAMWQIRKLTRENKRLSNAIAKLVIAGKTANQELREEVNRLTSL